MAQTIIPKQHDYYSNFTTKHNDSYSINAPPEIPESTWAGADTTSVGEVITSTTSTSLTVKT